MTRRWILLWMGTGGCVSYEVGDKSGPDTLSGDATDGDADTDADTDTDSDTDPDTSTDTGGAGNGTPCALQVLHRFPADGAADVYPGTRVWFLLTETDPGASIAVTDSAGTVVPGATTVQDLRATWTGDTLGSETEYQARLTHRCGADANTFVTSDMGAPLAVDPTGEVYAIDLGTGIWVEPVGLGALLAAELGETDLLISPIAVDPGGLELLGGLATNGVQEICSPTIPLPSAWWDDPYFELASPLLPLDFGGVSVDVADVELSGSFASDGSRVQFGVLKGLIDTRPLGEALGIGMSEDAVCVLVATFGLVCEPCADGAAFCMSVEVDDLEAPNVGGAIVPRTAEDVLYDPYCPP